MSEIQQIERQALNALRGVLARADFLSVGDPEQQRLLDSPSASRPDFVLPVTVGNHQWHLVCEAKSLGQPRHARNAVLQLTEYIRTPNVTNGYPVFLAPYISPESAEICHKAGVGHVDFAGNCRLQFDTVLIERSGAANPQPDKRGLHSIFAPKSARILRRLLQEPRRLWRVVELAVATETSLGQVSNVRRALIDHEWAAANAGGLRLVLPDALLDAWRDAYSRRRIERHRYYTLFHGDSLDARIKESFAVAPPESHVLLASYSAARWLAPFSRHPAQHFYADADGEVFLMEQLQLEPAAKGENVVIDRPVDDGLFSDRIEAAPGLWSTGLVQTYLDLAVSGDRGLEAAEHLRQTRIEPVWKVTP